jgi:hypothetical protein
MLPLLVLLLSACTTTPSGIRAVTHDETFTVHWTTDVSSILLDEYFVIEVVVQPAPEAVVIDAVMPSHRHGMLNDASMERLGPTTWTASDMLFHMPGHWRVRFDMTDAHGIVHRAETDVILE